MEILGFISVGIVAGLVAGRFMRGHGFGVIGDALVGIAGAFVGGLVFTAVGTDIGGGLAGRLIVALIGALLVLLVVRRVIRARGGPKVWS